MTGESNTEEALLTDTLVSGQFHIRTPSQRSYNLCVFTFPLTVGSSNGHLFRVPRVSAHESFYSSLFRRSQNPHFQNEANCEFWHNGENELNLHESLKLFSYQNGFGTYVMLRCRPLKLVMKQRIASERVVASNSNLSTSCGTTQFPVLALTLNSPL